MDLEALQADPEFLLRCAINRDWDTLIEFGTLLGMNYVLRTTDERCKRFVAHDTHVVAFNKQTNK